MTPTVREAVAADAAPVGELLAELGYRPDGGSASRLERWILGPDRLLLVAGDGGPELLGLVALAMTPRLESDRAVAQIVALIVAERARGRGTGRELVLAVESRAAAAGCDAVVVSSGRDRRGAHAFYRGLGYRDRDDRTELIHPITARPRSGRGSPARGGGPDPHELADHGGVEVVRSFYDAFDGRPYEDSVAAWLTADVVWQVAGSNPLAGTFRGVGEVLEAMRRDGESSGHTLELDTISLFGDGTHVVAVHDASAQVPGLGYHAHEVDVFHIRGRRISAMWSFSEDQAATDRLWSAPRPSGSMGPPPDR